MSLYETHFDPDTKEIREHSVVSELQDFDEVNLFHGDPVVAKPVYQVHEGGLLVSTFPWSLPSAGQAISDPIWAG